MNAGIAIAAGECIAWLSSDDRFYPGKLEKQLAYMIPRNGEISFNLPAIALKAETTRQRWWPPLDQWIKSRLRP